MIWLRAFDLDTQDELKAAVNHAAVVRYLGEIPLNSLVVGRYSVLPMYQWISEELALGGSQLVNSYAEHKYIANMEWLEDLDGLTFPTFTRWDTLPEGSYVVKGRTNSRKWEWKTKMFAETAEDVKRIAVALYEDPLIREQGVVARTYVPLEQVAEGINGLPVTNEWRFFVFDGKILTSAYYWSSVPEEDLSFDPLTAPPEATALVETVIARVADKATFYVVDVAKGVDGRWWVVELNDGQMSGLSYTDPVDFYEGLDTAGQELAQKRGLRWSHEDRVQSFAISSLAVSARDMEFDDDDSDYDDEDEELKDPSEFADYTFWITFRDRVGETIYGEPYTHEEWGDKEGEWCLDIGFLDPEFDHNVLMDDENLWWLQVLAEMCMEHLNEKISPAGPIFAIDTVCCEGMMCVYRLESSPQVSFEPYMLDFEEAMKTLVRAAIAGDIKVSPEDL